MTSPLPAVPSGKHVVLFWEHDFSAWIGACLGRPWSIQQNAFLAQKTLTVLDVYYEPGDEVSEANIAAVEEWLTKPVPEFYGRYEEEGIGTEEIMTYLCKQGFILPGEYYLHVWW